MTLQELIMKHSTNLLALAKIYGAFTAVAQTWEVEVSKIEIGGDITLYLTNDQLETADSAFYKRNMFMETLQILRIDNPELF